MTNAALSFLRFEIVVAQLVLVELKAVVPRPKVLKAENYSDRTHRTSAFRYL